MPSSSTFARLAIAAAPSIGSAKPSAVTDATIVSSLLWLMRDMAAAPPEVLAQLEAQAVVLRSAMPGTDGTAEFDAESQPVTSRRDGAARVGGKGSPKKARPSNVPSNAPSNILSNGGTGTSALKSGGTFSGEKVSCVFGNVL